MLVVMAGLPGTGKSAVAAQIAIAMKAVLLAVDVVEASLLGAGIRDDQPTGLAAYMTVDALAREQLRCDRDVVIDAVNDDPRARAQWEDLAAEAGVQLVWIEVFCSDKALHRIRLEGRRRDLGPLPEPTWDETLARAGGFQDWDAERLRLDAIHPLHALAAQAVEHVRAAAVEPAS